jgi:hypothetical protein
MATVRIHDGIESYVTDMGLPISELKTMTNAEIEGYLNPENFREMFSGCEDADVVPYEWSELIETAKDLRDRANGDEDEA